MSKVYEVLKDFLTRGNKEFEVGQEVYDSETGRIGLVELFDTERRKMKVRHRHNVTCEYSGAEINRFKPYFGMLDPCKDGGYEDGYIDTIYDSENQCDRCAFMEV